MHVRAFKVACIIGVWGGDFGEGAVGLRSARTASAGSFFILVVVTAQKAIPKHVRMGVATRENYGGDPTWSRLRFT